MTVEVKKGRFGTRGAIAYYLTCGCGWDTTVFTEAGAEVIGQDHLTQAHKGHKGNSVIFLDKKEDYAE